MLFALFPDPLVETSFQLYLTQPLPKGTFDQSMPLIRLHLYSEIISFLCITVDFKKYGIKKPLKPPGPTHLLWPPYGTPL